MRPSEKAIEAICEVIRNGANKEEIIKYSGYGATAVNATLSLLRDQGRLFEEVVDQQSGRKEFFLINDPKDLEEIKKLERREKYSGIKMNADEAAVHKLLKKGGITVGGISRTLNKPKGVSKEYVYQVLESLRKKGFAVSIDDARKEAVLDTSEAAKKDMKPLELEPLFKHRIKFAFLGDTQLGSKYQQLTLLRTAYEILNEEGIDFAIHLGDLVDGIKMYRGHEQEIFLQGADDQANYAINEYPEGKGYKTYIIAGNHDLSFKKVAGYDIIERICENRPDLVYKGEIGAHTFKIKNLVFDIIHPSGGVPYAKSYRIQKIIEGALGDIISRIRVTKDVTMIPHFIALGHLHVACYTPHIGIKGFMVPCFQSQTPYLKAKGLMPEIGFIILTVECDDEWNINKVTIDHHDLGTYVKEDDY